MRACVCVFMCASVCVYLYVLICFLPGYLSYQLSVAWQGSQSTLFMINRHVYCSFFFYIMLLFIHTPTYTMIMYMINCQLSQLLSYSNLKHLFNIYSCFIRIIISSQIRYLFPKSEAFFYSKCEQIETRDLIVKLLLLYSKINKYFDIRKSVKVSRISWIAFNKIVKIIYAFNNCDKFK